MENSAQAFRPGLHAECSVPMDVLCRAHRTALYTALRPTAETELRRCPPRCFGDTCRPPLARLLRNRSFHLASSGWEQTGSVFRLNGAEYWAAEYSTIARRQRREKQEAQ